MSDAVLRTHVQTAGARTGDEGSLGVTTAGHGCDLSHAGEPARTTGAPVVAGKCSAADLVEESESAGKDVKIVARVESLRLNIDRLTAKDALGIATACRQIA